MSLKPKLFLVEVSPNLSVQKSPIGVVELGRRHSWQVCVLYLSIARYLQGQP